MDKGKILKCLVIIFKRLTPKLGFVSHPKDRDGIRSRYLGKSLMYFRILDLNLQVSGYWHTAKVNCLVQFL